MRIVAGAWRGRNLVAPPSQTTRPTADRARQALFDMLLHAPWGGRAVIEGVQVLDVFAGTGALGLEALSRGAACCSFIESDPSALRALRSNIAACKANERCLVVSVDVLTIGTPQGGGPGASHGAMPGAGAAQAAPQGARLVFLDPPYRQDLVPRALAHLQRNGWLAPEALVVAETSREEDWAPAEGVLAERTYGAARMLIFRVERADAGR